MDPVERARMYIGRYGAVGTIRRIIRSPSKLSRILSKSPPHFYHVETRVSDKQIADFITDFVNTTPETVQEHLDQILDRNSFVDSIEQAFAKSNQRPTSLHRNWRESLYVLCRLSEPETVVETGIYDGLSSAYILQALEDNSRGTLVSIDVNDTTYMPTDLDFRDTGWLVPESLSDRWDLRYGDARQLLPKLASKTEFDLFIHDSLHTEEHMRFEFETARDAMSRGDYLISDNVMLNKAFEEFASEHLERVSYLNNTSEPVTYEGEKVDDKLGAGVIQ